MLTEGTSLRGDEGLRDDGGNPRAMDFRAGCMKLEKENAIVTVFDKEIATVAIFDKEIATVTATLDGCVVSNFAVTCFPRTGGNNTMAEAGKIEKFARNELTGLRDELMRSGIDLWQAGEVLSAFLAGRGYGVAPEQARDAVLRLEGAGCSHECIQTELERVALVM